MTHPTDTLNPSAVIPPWSERPEVLAISDDVEWSDTHQVIVDSAKAAEIAELRAALTAGRAALAQPQDVLTVNLMRLAWLDKHKARECAEIVAQVIAAAPQPPQANMPAPWCPDVCPITGLPFFMWLEHHSTGEMTPTYGGPYDSYTIPVRDESGAYLRERYDHDRGGWLVDEREDVGVQIVDDQLYVSDEPPQAERVPPCSNCVGQGWEPSVDQGCVPFSVCTPQQAERDDHLFSEWMRISGGDIDGWPSVRLFAEAMLEAKPPQAERVPLDSEHRKAIMESAINGKTDMGDMEYVSWIIDATERAHGMGVNL